MRTLRALVPVVLATGLLAAPAYAAPPGPTCDGRPATIVGTEGADRILGTAGPDVIVALGGDDRVWAGGGDDVVCGGRGADVLDGGAGDDRLFGQLDRVAQYSRAGISRFGDTLRGGPGSDVLSGGADPRRVEYVYSQDTLDYSRAPHGVHVDLAARRASGRGSGVDRIVGVRQLEVRGSSYADVLRGSAGPDRLVGGRGPDVLVGRGGADELWGESGEPHEPPDRDRLWGGPGRDTLLSDRGEDVLHGGAGADQLASSSAAPTRLYGGPGDDQVIQVVPRRSGWVSDGGPGRNLLQLTTSFAATDPGATVTIDLRGGPTGVDLTPSSVGAVAGYADLFLEGEVGWSVVGSDGPDHVDGTLGGNLRFLGDGGDDSVAGPPRPYRMLVDGGPGSDRASGRGECDHVERGSCR